MDTTLQVKMDSQLKDHVEELYRGLGVSFAAAVRMFAEQSLKVGGLPFRPELEYWDELTEEEIHRKLAAAQADVEAGRVYSREEAERMMRERFHYEFCTRGRDLAAHLQKP